MVGGGGKHIHQTTTSRRTALTELGRDYKTEGRTKRGFEVRESIFGHVRTLLVRGCNQWASGLEGFFWCAEVYLFFARVAPGVAQKAADSFLLFSLSTAARGLVDGCGPLADVSFPRHLYLVLRSYRGECWEETIEPTAMKGRRLKKNWKDNEGFYFEGGFLFNWHLWQVIMILFNYFFLSCGTRMHVSHLFFEVGRQDHTFGLCFDSLGHDFIDVKIEERTGSMEMICAFSTVPTVKSDPWTHQLFLPFLHFNRSAASSTCLMNNWKKQTLAEAAGSTNPPFKHQKNPDPNCPVLSWIICIYVEKHTHTHSAMTCRVCLCPNTGNAVFPCGASVWNARPCTCIPIGGWNGDGESS